MNKWNTFIQFRNYSLRTKMILVIVAIVVGSVGIVAFLTNRSLTASLTENIGNNLAELANARSTEIGLAVQREIQALKVLALSKTLQNAAMVANQANPLSQNEINQLDQQWRAADEANNDADPLVASVLNNEISSELRKFREQFPQQVEVFLTDTQGVNIASTNRTSDYLQADEKWWQTAYKDGQYIGQPEFDDSSKTIAINMAVTIRQNGDGEILGVLRTTVNFTALSDSLIAGLFGQTGRTDIYLPDGQEFKLIISKDGQYEMIQVDSAPDIKTLAGSPQNYMQVSLDGNATLASKAKVALPGITGEDTKVIENLNWYVITLQDQSEALQPVSAQARNDLLLAFGISIAAAFAAIFLAQFISGPIVRLKAIAEKVASGDLTAQARVETGDETGALATAFNAMTSQVRDLIGSLERRVADRTKALATSAEVSRRLATVLDPHQLVSDVVDEVRDAFDYYYAQIYLLDDAGENLVMTGGTGDAGASMLARGHSLPKGRGLVGHAADTNASVLVPDVSQEDDWLPNELLPETKAEAAIPISIGDQVLGVLDVQHNLVDGLSHEDVILLESLAGQVAISLRNARSYEQTRSQAEIQALVNVIGQKIQHTTSIEDTLQTAIRELGTAIGTSRVRVKIQSASKAVSTESTSAE